MSEYNCDDIRVETTEQVTYLIIDGVHENLKCDGEKVWHSGDGVRVEEVRRALDAIEGSAKRVEFVDNAIVEDDASKTDNTDIIFEYDSTGKRRSTAADLRRLMEAAERKFDK